MGLDDRTKAWLNACAGLLYVSVLCFLTLFWPTSSLVLLLAAHIVGGFIVGRNEKTRKEHGLDDDGPVLWRLQLDSWHHIHGPNVPWHYFMAIAHLFIVFMNMLGFLEVTIKEMPPSTIRFGSEMQLDHTRFGVDGFKQPALPTDRSRFSLVQMAQRGFYYAEEYRGEFGAPPADPNFPRFCTPNSGWRCFAVGVRTFNNGNPSSSSTPSSGDSWYQPLPTRGYNVDLQVAAAVDAAVAVNGSAAAVDPCTTLGEIYIQHVNGFGQTVGSFRPIMEFNGSQPHTISLCPGDGVSMGCSMQAQTAAAYVTSLRAECTRIRKDEEYGAGYKAAYIPIPQSTSTVDMSTGAITHTIIIMREATKPAAVLRVKPVEATTTAPLFSLFHPMYDADWHAVLGGGGDVTAWRKDGVRYLSAGSALLYAQPYAAASNMTGKSIPRNYRQVNYQAWIGFYVGFLFLIPICVGWYFVVMGVPTFEDSPRFATWFVVRLPILIAAGSLGSMIYCLAQAGIIIAAYLHRHGTRWAYAAAMGCAFGINVLHLAYWGVYMTKHGHLSSFAPYVNEEIAGETGWLVSRGATTLFLPLMKIFMLVEPTVWCFITLLRVAVTVAVEKLGIHTFDFEMYTPTPEEAARKAARSSANSRYQLLTTTAARKGNKI